MGDSRVETMRGEFAYERRGICHRQDKDRSTEERRERGFNEAFTPRGTNRQLLVEGLPTYPDSGHDNIGVVISKVLIPSRGIKLQGIRSRNAHLRAGNRDLRLGKDAIRFAPAKTWFGDADTNLIAGFVRIIRVKIKLFPTPVAAEGESNRPRRQLK